MASILVVEDEALVRLATMAVLTADGHACCGVASAPDAIALLESGRPDLLLLDWNLAAGSCGGDVVAANSGGVPFILTTATLEDADAQQLGAAALLPKPFSAEGLRRVVAQALHGRTVICGGAGLH